MKDLYRWTFDPIGLLEQGAAEAPVFTIRLWRRAIVGFHPSWNRAVLGDLETFRSHGSLSALTPYLRGGVVHLDQPGHDPRRRVLNPVMHHRGLDLNLNVSLPTEEFDALHWAGEVVRRMLNAALFGGRLPDRLVREFVTPLTKPVPSPLLPRRFGRIRRAIAAVVDEPPPESIAAALVKAGVDGVPYDVAEELRVLLAAGYDTTTHTLAWAIWELAHHPEWQDPALLPLALNEVLRLYPAGWLGSRRAAVDTRIGDVAIPRGTLVCYSPYLTHRDPALWPAPLDFQPSRFESKPQPWTFIPFAAGSRTCLGMHLAIMMLTAALTPLCEAGMVPLGGDAGKTTGITLRPVGPLWIKVAG